jgi:hypothetical protein
MGTACATFVENGADTIASAAHSAAIGIARVRPDCPIRNAFTSSRYFEADLFLLYDVICDIFSSIPPLFFTQPSPAPLSPPRLAKYCIIWNTYPPSNRTKGLCFSAYFSLPML